MTSINKTANDIINNFVSSEQKYKMWISKNCKDVKNYDDWQKKINEFKRKFNLSANYAETLFNKYLKFNLKTH